LYYNLSVTDNILELSKSIMELSKSLSKSLCKSFNLNEISEFNFDDDTFAYKVNYYTNYNAIDDFGKNKCTTNSSQNGCTTNSGQNGCIVNPIQVKPIRCDATIVKCEHKQDYHVWTLVMKDTLVVSDNTNSENDMSLRIPITPSYLCKLLYYHKMKTLGELKLFKFIFPDKPEHSTSILELKLRIELPYGNEIIDIPHDDDEILVKTVSFYLTPTEISDSERFNKTLLKMKEEITAENKNNMAILETQITSFKNEIDVLSNKIMSIATNCNNNNINLQVLADLDKTRGDLAKTKDDLAKIKDEFSKYATKGQLIEYANMKDLNKYATKTDFGQYNAILEDMPKIRGELGKIKDDLTKYATKGQLFEYATTKELTKYATKTDFDNSTTNTESMTKISQELAKTKEDLSKTKVDLNKTNEALGKTMDELNRHANKGQTTSCDLAYNAIKGELSNCATKNDLSNCATKNDLAKIKEELVKTKNELTKVKEELAKCVNSTRGNESAKCADKGDVAIINGNANANTANTNISYGYNYPSQYVSPYVYPNRGDSPYNEPAKSANKENVAVHNKTEAPHIAPKST
jgi:hypothetical protein